MAYKDLDSASVSDLRSIEYTAGSEPWNRVLDAFTIDTQDTDTAGYTPDWSKWHGYYRTIPMVRSVIDKLAMWAVGKGFSAKPSAKKLLQRINGNGKDTFNSILNNQVRVYKTCGDSYSEICRDRQKRILNLKPLDPGTIRTRAKKTGMILQYEQIQSKPNDVNQSPEILNTWQPEDILHLSNNRIADEIHGIPVTESLQSIIKMWWMAMTDQSVIFHRYVKPLLVWKLATDDTAEIATFKAKDIEANKEMENIYIPQETADLERMSIPQYSTLDPLPWIKMLETHFIRCMGVPEIILGHSAEESEATAKIMYLAFQQTIEWEQLYLQDQIKAQLGTEIKLEFPASIDPAIMSDSRKNTGNAVTQTDPTSEKKSDAKGN